ncbi:MAG TPA: VCBS repeat-containing protein, partial [Candidatus Nanopelagicales bacterium]|nr:VCBS repeat-containing protein [Candidatus Nanopelagicales bacterium]
GYQGVDRVGRPTTATRVATSRGVVLAVGPLALGDLDRGRATELLTSPVGGEPPGEGMVTGALADLNGDGYPDVVLRSEVGTLEVWGLRLFSSAAYPIELGVAPTLALDADDDGRMDLGGRPLPLEADPIAPDLLEVATFEAGRYSSRSAAARAFHARRAGLVQVNAPTAPAAPTASATRPPDDPTRLRRALERAWHAALAGEPAKDLLARLDQERVPPELEEAFAAHRARVARVARERPAKETTPTEKAARTPAGT